MNGVNLPRIIVLGNPAAGDDGAAVEAATRLGARHHVVLAGRPGPGLLDLLAGEAPVVLVDVVRSASPVGTVHRVPLADLAELASARGQVSSHGFGPAEALRLGAVLGRPAPRGWFVGIEGAEFPPRPGLSEAVEAAISKLVAAIEAAAERAVLQVAGPG